MHRVTGAPSRGLQAHYSCGLAVWLVGAGVPEHSSRLLLLLLLGPVARWPAALHVCISRCCVGSSWRTCCMGGGRLTEELLCWHQHQLVQDWQYCVVISCCVVGPRPGVVGTHCRVC